MSAGPADGDLKKEEYKLQREHELRFEVEGNEKVVLRLKNGLAEIFGTELMKNRPYTFYGGSKVAVYTCHGCSVELEGNPEVAYEAKETPMTFYLNIHGLLEQMRDSAASIGDRGPVVLICGPGDVGKSTLTRILCNYAVRAQRTPLVADLDVGQGSVSVPGTIGLNVVERQADVEAGFSEVAPLVFHFGYQNPAGNMPLYNLVVNKAASAMFAKFDADRKVKTSGCIINTCGWVTGGGLKALVNAIKAFEVVVVLVLDQERLYIELEKELPENFAKVVFVPKSGGVVVRSKQFRTESRDARIREYFYGTPQKTATTRFYPHSFDVPFSQMKNRIFKIGGVTLPSSCLPIGMKADDNQTKLTPIQAIHQLVKHQLLSLSTCPVAEKHYAIESNIQGVICVTDVDPDAGTVTVLSPQPRPLPSDCVFLTSEVQFMDST